MKPSGIGGQAVIEGIMMRNKDKYSIAVRKPDKEIEVIVKESRLLTDKHKWLNFPIIRGVVNFIDSLVTGISTINYSASFYDDPEEQKTTKVDEVGKAVFKDKFESILMAFTVIVSVFLAVGLFMLLPYFVSRLAKDYISSKTLLNFIEGMVRLAIFVLYLLLISLMKDIRRTFMYHGAEHKCINCIENGARLSVDNVKNSSRYHKRCGTSFMFIVMFISIVFFIFIRVDNTILQIVVRILLIPVIAGVSYEFIRWAGRNDNKFTQILSKPGMWFQNLTTREPDRDMIEVAIKAVEEVFDWKAFLQEYYADSTDPGADLLAAEAELALASQLLQSGRKSRSMDVKEAESKVKKRSGRKLTAEERYLKQMKSAEAEAQSEDSKKDDLAYQPEEKILSKSEDVSGDTSVEKEADSLLGIDFEEDHVNTHLYDGLSALSEDQNASATREVYAEDEISDDDITVEEAEAGIEFEEESAVGQEEVYADDVPVFKQRGNE